MGIRWLMCRILILAMVLLPACSSDESTGPGDTTPRGGISGVVSSSRAPIEDVLVSVGNLSAVSNQDGWFAISGVPAQAAAVVEFSYDGYLSAFRSVAVLEGQTTHLPDVQLLVAELVVLDAAAGGQAATGDGDGRAVFPANAFVTGAGAPYTGNVEVEITASVPEDSDFFDAFPGAFEGETATGETVPFISFGFMGVNTYSEGRGEPVQLADGVSAELAIRVSDEIARAAPDTIPMWWFDEARGVWVEEGEAVKVGTEYVTEVEHFTIWNWDLPVTDIAWVSGTVQDMDGDPVPDARVHSQGYGCTFADEAITDAGGSFRIRSIKECEAQFWALSGSFASQIEVLGVGADDDQILSVPLVLSVPAISIMAVWGLNPDDLDAHFLIPMTWDEQWDYYHIYYSNMGNLGSDPYAALNTDDTESFGPEIITGTRLYPGTYSYFIHHYSGEGDIGSSPTYVTLEVGNYYRTWNAATAAGSFHEGGEWQDVEDQQEMEDYWHVFDMTVSEQGDVSVTSVNRAVGSSYDEDGPWNGWGVNIYEDYLRSTPKPRKR